MAKLVSYLRDSVFTVRFLKFGIVGASGILVNMGILYVLTEYASLKYFIASPIAIETSILSNFFINLVWTWSDRSGVGSVWTKLVRYHIGAGATAIFVNYLILVGLTELVHLHYLVSNLIGIAFGTLSNFVVNDLWTFKHKRQSPL
jgi:dolichol-phosphate mannosyltransferase